MPRTFGVDRDLMSIGDVCRRLGVTREWFARADNKKRLKANGFPDAVPGMGRRWDPIAIDHYLNRFLPADLRPAPAPVAPAGDSKVDHATTVLQQRLQAMSGAHA